MISNKLAFSSIFPYLGLKSTSQSSNIENSKAPLREFIYLDEISLSSLLASQKGEITDNITAKSEVALLAESGGKISAKSAVGPAAEITSRFQSTNSNAIQTVRKANAQSLFRELHMLQNLRKIQPETAVNLPDSMDILFSNPEEYSAYKSTDLKRGDLLEFRVRLSASWIFQISSMIAEFSDMFDDSPTMFIENVKFSDLYNAKNANKIINRLLAGLIPIDGIASDYSVVLDGKEEYIVDNRALENFDIETAPLKIVGVTEHSAYWKDIRRVLFAENEFTVLCRLSKSGLQSDWNPIKAADIFRDFVPDLAKQIEESSKMAMLASTDSSPNGGSEPLNNQLLMALIKYKEIILSSLVKKISDTASDNIDRSIALRNFVFETAEGQRAAFSQVKAVIEDVSGEIIAPEADFSARERARKALNLPLFPDFAKSKDSQFTPTPVMLDSKRSRMLDVEVVAIYW
ncbi:hypothetical protein QUC32_28715 (plasmid) [Novosphingobium resinovorum]|uniref:DUF6414 family protein n=2 Tax=Novosphingobium TaxID=165696 RepID=UPI0025A1C0FD|nr:hypothetical protein [Novosphingobium resinovorum]MBF7015659.1 hypothetical protein [Novosphingobium sp. HR1a]WJM30334.1 hypothetical protein QUC32_28715 [Novosphingobium resinovorum]